MYGSASLVGPLCPPVQTAYKLFLPEVLAVVNGGPDNSIVGSVVECSPAKRDILVRAPVSSEM